MGKREIKNQKIKVLLLLHIKEHHKNVLTEQLHSRVFPCLRHMETVWVSSSAYKVLTQLWYCSTAKAVLAWGNHLPPRGWALLALGTRLLHFIHPARHLQPHCPKVFCYDVFWIKTNCEELLVHTISNHRTIKSFLLYGKCIFSER